MLPAALQGSQASPHGDRLFSLRTCRSLPRAVFLLYRPHRQRLSRGCQIHCHRCSPPLSPWPRAVHLLRHPFRWPLLSPTAIWDLKCLVSLSCLNALSAPIIDKTSLLSSPSFFR
jgi:hypothetical protein